MKVSAQILKVFCFAICLSSIILSTPCYAKSKSSNQKQIIEATQQEIKQYSSTEPDPLEENLNSIQNDTQSGMTEAEKIISAESEKPSKTNPGVKENDFASHFLFGADFGVQSAFPSAKLMSFGPKHGLAVESKAIGSIQFNKIMLDAGIGWYFFNISGKEPRRVNGVILTTDNDEDIVDELGIRLSGTVVELSPSYLFGSDFFSGPVVSVRYPSDLGYDSRIVRKELGLSAGIQGGYQIQEDDLNTRIVSRLMMSVNDISWLSTSLMFGIQVGIPLTQKSNTGNGESKLENPEGQKATEIRADEPKAEFKKQEYMIQIDSNVTKLTLLDIITFYDAPGYPTLTQEAQSLLMTLAQSFLAVQDEWKQLKIETATSEQAQVIRDALVSNGLSETKIEIQKETSQDSVPSPKVDLHFVGVKNAEKISYQITNAMDILKIPHAN